MHDWIVKKGLRKSAHLSSAGKKSLDDTNCCSVLQCVAVCCGVLQCIVECCSVLQGIAVYHSVLQCVAVCYSVLQWFCNIVAVCFSLRDFNISRQKYSRLVHSRVVRV